MQIAVAQFLVALLTLSHLVLAAIVDITPYKQLIHDLHNGYRKKPHSSNMKYMAWSDTLAHEADLWARGCRFDHQMKGRGENLYFNTVITEMKGMITDSLHAWYDENRYYHYGTQSCGSQCHYVQMVWAKTNEVGCAINMCDYLAVWGRYERNSFYLVCFYAPKGNWIGEYPYLQGPACSRCDHETGETCVDGLCRATGGTIPGTGNPQVTTPSGHCVDSYSQTDCPAWAKRGDCSRNPGFMLINCQKSCGVCNSGTDTDIFDTTQCHQWAAIGECTRNASWMMVNCKKTCTSHISVTTAAPVADCRDIYSQTQCADWAKNGECSRNPGFMLVECKRSCNACG